MKKQDTGMTVIVKTVTRFTVWLILLYGFYLVIHGHLTPGGGFAGGLVFALSLIHLTLAYGGEFTRRRWNADLLHGLEAAGALAFLLLGALGLFLTGAFFLNILAKGRLFSLFSAGTIPLLNIIIGIKVGAGLYLVFRYLAEYRDEPGFESPRRT